MRVRAALAALSALILVLTVVFALSGKAEGEALGAPRTAQILSEPDPPHRVLAVPLDAATLDPAPPARVKPKAHPTGTRNHPRSVRIPSSLAAFMRCVSNRESHGNYKAENPTSTASGRWQFIDASWVSYSKMAGHPGWSHAASAPPAVQDAVALWVMVNKGRYPWKGKGC